MVSVLWLELDSYILFTTWNTFLITQREQYAIKPYQNAEVRKTHIWLTFNQKVPRIHSGE